MEEKLYDFHKESQFKHWWFIGRNKIINSFLKSELKKRDNEILDIGAGFGACIPVLKLFGKVDALEPYEKAYDSLKEVGASTVYNISDFPHNYPPKTYDIVTFFDVIEHLENDIETLKVVKHSLLRKGGKSIITVPAYQWLWSKHDEQNKHYRRYNKKTLQEALEQAGFKNIRISYFMTFLFPFAVIERLLSKISSRSPEADKNKYGVTNKILGKILKSEAPIISRFNFPFGLSLIAKAEKE